MVMMEGILWKWTNYLSGKLLIKPRLNKVINSYTFSCK